MTLASTTARGYGAEHQALRVAWAPHVEAGVVACWRCGHIIIPDPTLTGRGWDLGHDDHNRAITHGPEHTRCNRAASAILSNQRRAVRNLHRRLRQCEICGAWYTANHRDQRTCSRACGWELRRRNNPPKREPQPVNDLRYRDRASTRNQLRTSRAW